MSIITAFDKSSEYFNHLTTIFLFMSYIHYFSYPWKNKNYSGNQNIIEKYIVDNNLSNS